ncbi:MAG: D-alanyl-D-alanine carboxypeptidase [Clostridia bacterium]|nr:D-alanyl-D-alanine carboxypeptidase [Clostridia bacterium]
MQPLMTFIKRLTSMLLIGLMLSSTFVAYAEYDPEHPELLTEEDIGADSCILIEQTSGDVIFEKDADRLMYPASTTKIMTVLLGLLTSDDLDELVTVSYAGSKEGVQTLLDPESSYLGLKEGEQLTMRDLLYGTILRSGNDGAIAIAEHVSGSEAAFVDLMNQTAQAFGMTNTNFLNAHGLHQDYHYTTARDLATLSYEAMKNEVFADIASRVTYNMSATELQKERTISTGHRIMLKTYSGKENSYYYEYITGIKSGHTDAADYCYVGAAEKDGVKLISVVLHADRYDVWRDTKKLMEYGFSQYTSATLTEMYLENPLKVYTSGYDKSDIGLGELELSASPVNPTQSVVITGTYDEIEQLTANLRNLVLVQYTRELKAPINAGEVIGRMTYVKENGEAVEYNLLATRSVVARKDAPPTLSQIIAMTEADPNPFPPLTVEIVLIVLSPLLIVAAIILIIRLFVRSYKRHYARLPKNKNRYVK